MHTERTDDYSIVRLKHFWLTHSYSADSGITIFKINLPGVAANNFKTCSWKAEASRFLNEVQSNQGCTVDSVSKQQVKKYSATNSTTTKAIALTNLYNLFMKMLQCIKNIACFIKFKNIRITTKMHNDIVIRIR